MRLKIKQEFILAQAENKGTVMLYTLLDDKFNKFTTIGEKTEGLEEMSKVEVEMDVNLKSERFELKNEDNAKFVNTANVFITKVTPIKAGDKDGNQAK